MYPYEQIKRTRVACKVSFINIFYSIYAKIFNKLFTGTAENLYPA